MKATIKMYYVGCEYREFCSVIARTRAVNFASAGFLAGEIRMDGMVPMPIATVRAGPKPTVAHAVAELELAVLKVDAEGKLLVPDDESLIGDMLTDAVKAALSQARIFAKECQPIEVTVADRAKRCFMQRPTGEECNKACLRGSAVELVLVKSGNDYETWVRNTAAVPVQLQAGFRLCRTE